MNMEREEGPRESSNRKEGTVAETSSFLQPYVYFTLADPAMLPISPTYVAAGYPLCKPLKCLWKADRQKADSRILTGESILRRPVCVTSAVSECMKLSVCVREPHETRSAKKTRSSGGEERTKDTSSPNQHKKAKQST